MSAVLGPSEELGGEETFASADDTAASGLGRGAEPGQIRAVELAAPGRLMPISLATAATFACFVGNYELALARRPATVWRY